MNKNISMFCLTLKPEHEKMIKNLSYIPVGLGKKNFSQDCFSDKRGINIANKNPFYGEYTFHFWLWKNYLENIETEWTGFCQYRKFFVKDFIEVNDLDFKDLKNQIINKIEDKNKNLESILGNKFSVQNYKLSKILKHHLFYFLKNPSLFYNKNFRTLKVHFDLFHGNEYLESAINLLDEENKEDFRYFMNNSVSFNPHNMFICKTKLLQKYYKTVFPWLEKCENLFGFEKLNSYGLKRIYGFLAERFLSYWFTKNTICREMPIIVKNLSDYKNL